MPRILTLFAFCILPISLVAQPVPPQGPPGSIVIRPQVPGTQPNAESPAASGPVVFHKDPDRPGFLIIRPLGQQHAPIEIMPKDNTIPNLVIIRPSPMQKPVEPPVAPLPGAKPADPLKPDPKQAEDGKILLETWDAAFARGLKVGYFHVLVREYVRDGQRYIYATKEMKLQIARFGQPVETWVDESTMETLDGKVLATVSRQGVGKNQMLMIRGEVEDKKLKVTVEGAVKNTKEVDWPEGVLGVSLEANIIREKKLRPGESIGYTTFNNQLSTIVRYTATAGKPAEVVTQQGQKPRLLMPVRVDMAAIDDFKLPPGMQWVDPETYEQVLTEQEMPLFGGTMTILRCTKEAALRASPKLLDLAEVQSIVLAKEVPNAHAMNEITYRVSLSGDLALEKAFARDARQELKNADAKTRTFDLHVTAIRKPIPPKIPAEAPGKDYLSDCYFIDWDNKTVRDHAKAAIADLPMNASDWQKSQAVEKWVNQRMKPAEFSQAMASCSNVAKTFSGDCTEYSVLAAGMCRALGIPSRTAVGVVYAPPSIRAPKATLAWHMWFEVWADGGWVALDAVMGEGAIGPGHLKVTDASWHDEKSFKPLLPMMSLLGASPKVEVVQVK